MDDSKTIELESGPPGAPREEEMPSMDDFKTRELGLPPVELHIPRQVAKEILATDETVTNGPVLGPTAELIRGLQPLDSTCRDL